MTDTDSKTKGVAAVPDPGTVKTFRMLIHTMGAVWIIIGSLPILLVALARVQRGEILGEDSIDDLIGVIRVGIGAAWITFGVLACQKHLWAVYAGLALSYLFLIGIFMGGGNCIFFVISIIVILQAHDVIRWANRMRKAGIPLTAKPNR